MSKILKNVKESFELLKCLRLPHRIGFVHGHSHLNDNQLLQIKQVLDLNQNNKIITDYERQYSSLIGFGYGISFAAGRMAFYMLMKTLGIGRGDEVILPGFTCSVMPNAVWRTGAIPVFSDIDQETYGSDAGEIEKKITPRTKLIVAQHSFGIPCNIPAITDVGKKYGIFVIEDCAIALDSSINGVKVGNWGDAAIFSTDHSKPLNTIIGGLLYTKNKTLYEKIKELSVNLPHLDKFHQKRLFKQFLFERNNYTPSRYPRAILKNYFRLFASKIRPDHSKSTYLVGDYRKHTSANSHYPYPAKMPPFLAQLGLFELERWNSEKLRRKNLLKNYLCIIKQTVFNRYLPKAYFNPNLDIVPLRFIFKCPHSEKLMKKMGKFIDINSIWFRTPIICCPEGPESLGYTLGSCLIAEEICESIINWPCILPDGWDLKILEIFRQITNDNLVFH